MRSVFILLLALALLLPAQSGFAQPMPKAETSAYGPRKQVATIIFSGLAGAVLGLSTLSFYGRPQDKLSNIAVGFAVGVIIGTGYTTYQAATRPYERYQQDFGVMPNKEDLRFELENRTDFLPKISWQWSFD